MKKQEMIEEINKFLNAFSINSYLVPSGHTDFLYFSDIEEKTIYSKNFYKKEHGWNINLNNVFDNINILKEIQKAHFYLGEIYKEVHSLDINNELRKKISNEKKTIASAYKEIARLNKEIKDSKKV